MGEIVINKINKYENYIVCKKLRSGLKRKNKQVTWTKNQEWAGGAILNRMVPLGLIERVKLEQRLERGEEYLQGEGGDSTKAIGACQSGWSCQMGVSDRRN